MSVLSLRRPCVEMRREDLAHPGEEAGREVDVRRARRSHAGRKRAKPA
jgi:hypothetical protein